jgi:signal transduction histidine kinase
MAKKPTYEQLEQRVKELEKEAVERKRAEELLRLDETRLEALFHLSRMGDASLTEIAGFALDQGIKLTGSRIGFLGFLSEDESLYTLHAVSRSVMQDCKVVGDPIQWHISEAGIWADAIRHRKTLYVNDYAEPHPAKKGLPEGHFPIRRFMIVPVFEEKKIVAVAGVGNKTSDYNKTDERQLSMLMNGMWHYVQCNQAQEALRKAHDELEQRVKTRTAELAKTTEELKLQLAERKLAQEALRQSEQESALRNRIAQIFLTIPDEQMYGEVLQVILDALESKYGIFGYIDEHGLLVIPSMTTDIWEQCQVPDKTTVYPPETWGGIRGQSLTEKRSLYANEGLRVPEGHAPIIRGLVVCINYGGEVIGLLEVANKATDYDDKDKAFLEAIADHIAPVLNARLQRDRQEKKRNEAQEALIRLTYDLRKRVEELNCLYGISTLRENRSFSLEEILKGTVALIAPAWQYSEITCARIMLQGQEFTTDNFKETDWKQVSGIVVNGKRVGALEVFYLEEKPEADEGPFLKEERRLIDAIAERLGRITELKRAEEMLQEAHDQLERRVEERTTELRRLSSQLIKVQEDERKRISRELHDSVGQSLAAVKFGAENALNRMLEGTAKESVKALEALIPLIQQASEEARRIHTDLRPSLLDDLGITATVSWFCRECEKLYSGLRIEKHFDIEEKEVPEPLKIVIFRVLQEAVNNVAKHSKADLVRVSLKGTSGNIELAIEDKGQGFDVEHVRSVKLSKGRVGLASMRERTELSGGSFSIDSIKGQGTTVRALWQH